MAKYDWDTIRREYSTAQFSIAEPSRRHGCSRTVIQKKRDKQGWKKDNSEEVRSLANAKMVTGDAR